MNFNDTSQQNLKNISITTGDHQNLGESGHNLLNQQGSSNQSPSNANSGSSPKKSQGNPTSPSNTIKSLVDNMNFGASSELSNVSPGISNGSPGFSLSPGLSGKLGPDDGKKA
ncbi:hypothetical protein RhiXN_03501 [Rhizoctonia solani]|uniref:Uncharacterized protein n=1 Tax=Rhizoctonia solani TaxID=456999 RepID=A0A8H8NTR0_9AGAM|nr:uncharacterized protein RhiXN_03501 [Rhizoctonia solani]QRW18577.1 hypothetical protein RhiXN_03501 [Rhizoctonia solani]